VRTRHWWEAPDMQWRVDKSLAALIASAGAVVDAAGHSTIPVGRGRRLLESNLATANSNVCVCPTHTQHTQTCTHAARLCGAPAL
jgi:hypothetical protein